MVERSFKPTQSPLTRGMCVVLPEAEVICSFSNLHDSVRLMCDNEIAQRVGPLFGLDDEGGQRGVWKHSGHEGL